MSYDELSNATRIAALEEQVRQLAAENVRLSHEAATEREELEQYRMRLAGALIASEGGDGQPSDALEYLRKCPTITSVMKLRQALDRERERCGVLEREVWAARALGDASPLAMTFAKQQWVDARKATDTSHALDAAKFGKEPA